MNKNVLIVSLCMLMALLAVSCEDEVQPQPEAPRVVSVWDGTSVDTTWYAEDKTDFVLTEASQLAGLAKLVNEGNSFEDKAVCLDVDVDLASKPWTPIGQYKDAEGSSISGQLFSGSFDGNGHTIDGLMIDNANGKSSYRALFGYADGKICNFTVKGEVSGRDVSGVVAALGDGGSIDSVVSYVNLNNRASSETQGKTAGIVVTVKGNGTNGWTISNCKNYGDVSSTNETVGGILGWTADESGKLRIENCENHGEIKASGSINGDAGGIVGGCRTITIEGCINYGDVSASNRAGGIVGYNDTKNLSIKNSNNKGNVSGAESKHGGIAGCVLGNLEDCTTTGSLALVGILGDGSKQNSITYTVETAIEKSSVVYGSLVLKNVKFSKLDLHYDSHRNSTMNITVDLDCSSIGEMVVTMEQSANVSRLFLTKEGSSNIGSLKFAGSFDRQNSNTHGILFLFLNGVVGSEKIENELIYVNRDENSSDKDYGNASICWVETGTSGNGNYKDSNSNSIESVMNYNSSTDYWERKSN